MKTSCLMKCLTDDIRKFKSSLKHGLVKWLSDTNFDTKNPNGLILWVTNMKIFVDMKADIKEYEGMHCLRVLMFDIPVGFCSLGET